MRYHAPRYLFRRHEILRRVRAGRSFIEVGAANLALTRDLLNRFDSGLAIDFTDDLKQSYALLDPALQSRLEISNVDFLKAPISGKYDCVVACEVLEHVEDDAEFLRRARALLRPRGQMVISVPAKEKYWTVHDELVGHLRRYENAQIIALARDSGFDDITVTAYGYPWINLLSHLRVMLARRTLADRKNWDQQQQTSMSNHRQIPAWLSQSLVPVFLNRFAIYPFALISRLFNKLDLSDGYVVTMRRSDESSGN
tara:strand:+ start:21046 stop:21810 length:765 start_codon:yes stop_codon:yes gene_type:complete